MAEFSEINAKVDALQVAVDAAVAFIQGVPAQVAAAVAANDAGDNEALAGLSARLQADGDALIASMTPPA